MAWQLGEEGNKQQSRKASVSPSGPATQRTTVSKPMLSSTLHLIEESPYKLLAQVTHA